MPMVNLEALACGTPIVTFATGGCPEAVDERTGVVVPKGDQAALNEAIRLLSAQKAQRMQACMQRAQRFDAAQTFRAYLDLYKELCR